MLLVVQAFTDMCWLQAEQKKRSKARKESQKAPSRFEEEKEKRGLLDKYDEEEEEAAMLIGDQGDHCNCWRQISDAIRVYGLLCYHV